MRVSGRIGKSFRASALYVAMAGMAVAPLAVSAQAVAPKNGNTSDTDPAADSASQWLINARKAMDEKDWDRAEQFIQIADAKYQGQAVNSPLAYTPSMATQELARRRGNSAAAKISS